MSFDVDVRFHWRGESAVLEFFQDCLEGTNHPADEPVHVDGYWGSVLVGYTNEGDDLDDVYDLFINKCDRWSSNGSPDVPVVEVTVHAPDAWHARPRRFFAVQCANATDKINEDGDSEADPHFRLIECPIERFDTTALSINGYVTVSSILEWSLRFDTIEEFVDYAIQTAGVTC